MKDIFPEEVNFNIEKDNLDIWGETPYYIFEDENNFYLMPREGGEINSVDEIDAVAAKAAWMRGAMSFGGNLASSGARLSSSAMKGISSSLGTSMKSFRGMSKRLQNSLGNSFKGSLSLGKKAVKNAADPSFAKKMGRGSADIAKKTSTLCSRNPKSCAAVSSVGRFGQRHYGKMIIGAGLATFLIANHANKSHMEQQCIAFCVPKGWDNLRTSLNNGTQSTAPNMSSANNCNTDSSNTNPICFRDITTLQSEPDFQMPEGGSIFPATWTANEQPFCTHQHYMKRKPAKKTGGECEDYCSVNCGILHRSAVEALGDTFEATVEMFNELAQGLVHCLPGGDMSQCPLTGWMQYVKYAIWAVIVIIVLLIIRSIFGMFGGGGRYRPPYYPRY